jgi:hypothetical protein
MNYRLLEEYKRIKSMIYFHQNQLFYGGYCSSLVENSSFVLEPLVASERSNIQHMEEVSRYQRELQFLVEREDFDESEALKIIGADVTGEQMLIKEAGIVGEDCCCCSVM